MTSKTFKSGTVIDSDWLNDVNSAVYNTVPTFASAVASIPTLQTAISAKQDPITRDLSNGFVGLTGYSINFKDATGAYVSQLANGNTAARTYTFPDKNITVAGTTNEVHTNPTIKGYVEQFQALNAGAAVTVNPSLGTLIELTVTANTTITLPTAAAGISYTLILVYTGTYTVAFTGGTNLRWAGGAAPAATSASGKIDKYVFSCGATYTLAQDGGRNF